MKSKSFDRERAQTFPSWFFEFHYPLSSLVQISTVSSWKYQPSSDCLSCNCEAVSLKRLLASQVTTNTKREVKQKETSEYVPRIWICREWSEEKGRREQRRWGSRNQKNLGKILDPNPNSRNSVPYSSRDPAKNNVFGVTLFCFSILVLRRRWIQPFKIGEKKRVSTWLYFCKINTIKKSHNVILQVIHHKRRTNPAQQSQTESVRFNPARLILIQSFITSITIYDVQFLIQWHLATNVSERLFLSQD